MVLTMAVRAVDYLPPIGITFTAFLDAIVAADTDLFPEDRNGFRRSLVESCRRRGIYPSSAARAPGTGSSPTSTSWEPLPTKQALVMATHDLAGGSARPARPVRGAGQLDRAWATALLAWGRSNAPLLGLDAATLEVDGGNASFRVNQDGFPTAVVSARFIQRAQPGRSGLPTRLAGVPLRRGDDRHRRGERAHPPRRAQPGPGRRSRRARPCWDDSSRRPSHSPWTPWTASGSIRPPALRPPRAAGRGSPDHVAGRRCGHPRRSAREGRRDDAPAVGVRPLKVRRIGGTIEVPHVL